MVAAAAIVADCGRGGRGDCRGGDGGTGGGAVVDAKEHGQKKRGETC